MTGRKEWNVMEAKLPTDRRRTGETGSLGSSKVQKYSCQFKKSSRSPLWNNIMCIKATVSSCFRKLLNLKKETTDEHVGSSLRVTDKHNVWIFWASSFNSVIISFSRWETRLNKICICFSEQFELDLRYFEVTSSSLCFKGSYQHSLPTS